MKISIVTFQDESAVAFANAEHAEYYAEWYGDGCELSTDVEVISEAEGRKLVAEIEATR